MTKVGPGIFKRVNKNKVTGRVWEQTLSVTQRGVTIKIMSNGIEATETFKYPSVSGRG